MGFVEAVKTCYGPKYARFSGRAARSEYWYFMLLHVLVLLCWLGLAVATDTLVALQYAYIGYLQGSPDGAPAAVWAIAGLYLAYQLISILPYSAVTTRRLHDRNISGWYFLIYMILNYIPAVALFLPALDRMLPQFFDVAVSLAMLAIFIVTILKGTEGPNRFGPDPLATRAREEIFA